MGALVGLFAFAHFNFFLKQYLVNCWISTDVSSVNSTSSKPSFSFIAFRANTRRFILLRLRISWQYRDLSYFHPSFLLEYRIVDADTDTFLSSFRSFWSSAEVSSSFCFIFSSMKFMSSWEIMPLRPLRWASLCFPSVCISL